MMFVSNHRSCKSHVIFRLSLAEIQGGHRADRSKWSDMGPLFSRPEINGFAWGDFFPTYRGYN